VIADFAAAAELEKRDEKIASLKKQLAELQRRDLYALRGSAGGNATGARTVLRRRLHPEFEHGDGAGTKNTRFPMVGYLVTTTGVPTPTRP